MAERAEAPADPARAARLKRLELAHADVMSRIASAVVPAYRELLERTLAALEQEIAATR